jgi:hypothetical protein
MTPGDCTSTRLAHAPASVAPATYNYSYTFGSGVNPNWALGSTVRMQLNFVDLAGVSHTADRTVTLDQDWSRSVNFSASYCYYSNYCVSYTSTGQEFVGQIRWR